MKEDEEHDDDAADDSDDEDDDKDDGTPGLFLSLSLLPLCSVNIVLFCFFFHIYIFLAGSSRWFTVCLAIYCMREW